MTYLSEKRPAFNCRVNEKPIKGRFLPLKPSFPFIKSSILGPLDSDSNSSKFEVSSMLLMVGTYGGTADGTKQNQIKKSKSL